MTISSRTPTGGPTISFDIGGTNLRAAVVAADGAVIDRVQRSSNGTAEDLEDGIVALVDELLVDHPDVVAVGLAVAGFLDYERRVVRFAPHLPWRDADVAARLGARLNVPLTLEHDANSAAWGEYRFGAARGADNWVLFALGTGIGGAMMNGGRIYRGTFGTAPEFGHLTVVPGGRPCSCGKRGCLERYCSGTALAATARELATTNRFGGPLAAACVDGTATGSDVMLAAQTGDALATAAVADFADWLGRALALVADVFDPELIVIGGGVAQAADQYLERSREVFSREITGAGYRPTARIEVARLGADAGIIGAADLARTEAGRA
ncbi:ROK family protein [uncultured Corynebacterium sp.]|uniref:ROK family protein n=1 Tax=uncultured Corynebacterium sp. TaxID=159447 RepID=UPI0025E859DF|nr:ROK family protein [uncultured Corynebacterium sp.]